MRRTFLSAVKVLSMAALLSSPAVADRAHFHICGSGKRVTCVVDGDTVWYRGTKYRFEEIDTPEKGNLAECMQEGLQAIAATERLAEILSSHEFSVVANGKDHYGRTLASFVIGETTAGEMLVREGLARRWRGRQEEWCR